jgi:hypothetical protein
MGRKKPYKTLLSLGWRMSKIEPALLLFGLDGKLSGLIITRVDDLYCAGEGQVYEASIETSKSAGSAERMWSRRTISPMTLTSMTPSRALTVWS